MKSKCVIITGATGFVGANLARRLLRDGHALHLLVRPEFNAWRLGGVLDQAQVHTALPTDESRIEEIVRNVRPDWIFHLAARGAYSWQNDVHEIMHTNLVLTVNLIQACLKTGFEAFINTGSSSEYGYKDHAPAESELPEPNSIYAAFKTSATLFCRYVAQSSKLNITTLRLYSVYGPFEDQRRLFPTLIREGLQGRLPPLVNPDITRDFVYVDDVIEAYLAVVSRPTGEPGAVYNVGTGVQTTIRNVVATAKRLMRISDEPKWGTMPDRNWDTTVWVADATRIRKELGWEPRVGLEDGLKRTIEWIRQHPDLR